MGVFDWSWVRWVLLAVLVIGAIGVAGVSMGGHVLVVENATTGETIIQAPVENGSTVGLAYMHSVEKSRVYDGYTVRGTTLVMTRMEFESFGWGLPADANVTLENGTYVYDPPGVYERIRVSPGSIANHTLTIDDRTYDLVERAGENSVIIRVTRYSYLTRLLRS